MESANVKVQNIFHGWSNTVCSTDCEHRRVCNTIYPRIMVCLRYIVVNTLQKGDDKDSSKNDDAAIKIWVATAGLLQLAQNCVEHPGIWITERPLCYNLCEEIIYLNVWWEIMFTWFWPTFSKAKIAMPFLLRGIKENIAFVVSEALLLFSLYIRLNILL